MTPQTQNANAGWRAALQAVFDTSRYESETALDRARGMYVLLLFLAAIFTVYAFFVGDLRQPENLTLFELAQQEWPFAFVIAVTYFNLIAGVVLTRLGRQDIAAWLLLFTMWLFAVVNNINDGFNGRVDTMLLGLIILTGGLVRLTRGVVVTTIASLITFYVARAVAHFSGFQPIDFNLITATLLLLSIAGVTYLFIRYARLNRVEGVSKAIRERLVLAEINTQISRRASERVGREATLNYALQLILENYRRFYHAQVFLINEAGVRADLVASTGSIGQQLIAQGHGLNVGSLSVIGQTTLNGQPVTARTGDRQTVHRRNEMLSETRLEAAFPMRITNRIVGALDLQSRDDAPLTNEEMATFQSLADSLALAIDNIRQFELAQERIVDNQRLVEQSRAALNEVRRLNQRLTGRAWSEYLRTLGQQPGLDVDFDTGASEANTNWTPTLEQAAENRSIVQDEGTIAVPLRIRGQVIGAMEFEIEQELTPQDLELISDISERFGLAAENTRLLEQSQRSAQRETLINEISSRLQTTNNVEATLAEAARSLRETLKAQRVLIRLGQPEDTNGKGQS